MSALDDCLRALAPLSDGERGRVLAELVRTYGLPAGTTVRMEGGGALVIGPPVTREDGRSCGAEGSERHGWRAANWTAGKDGRSNSSELFAAAVRDVERLLRESAYSLINGGVANVAGVIMAQIAHQERAPWPQVREAIRCAEEERHEGGSA